MDLDAFSIPRITRPRASAYSQSVASPKHPQRNEDACFADPRKGIGAVLDGMGGHDDGKLASGIGLRAAMSLAKKAKSVGVDWTTEVIARGRQELLKARDGKSNMGATAVVAAVTDRGVSIAWCGDSRAYGIYADGSVRQLTRDHSWLDGQRRAGKISEARAHELEQILETVEGQGKAMNLGEETFIAYMKRNTIISELGEGPIDSVLVPLDGLRAVVLTSDGVHDNLTATQLSETLSSATDDAGLQGLAQKVIDAAQREMLNPANGRAKKDDISAVVIPIQPVEVETGKIRSSLRRFRERAA